MSESSTSLGQDRLASVMDIPVTVTVVLGEKRMPLGKLYSLSRGSILEIDKKIGEPVDILVNNRLVARGEVQLTEEGRLAISMTEIASCTTA
ncbi:MAG TPA: flagellar motor switch protein FliN [Acetobacteraceae bacterium]|nr:flagellar motor switch protein FliN [Acetobacteraceae bacterium]